MKNEIKPDKDLISYEEKGYTPEGNEIVNIIFVAIALVIFVLVILLNK